MIKNHDCLLMKKKALERFVSEAETSCMFLRVDGLCVCMYGLRGPLKICKNLADLPKLSPRALHRFVFGISVSPPPQM